MAAFEGMVIDGKLCVTAREAADRAGVTTACIYKRAARGWQDGDPTHASFRKPCAIRDIEYRGKRYEDVPAAAAAENVSRVSVYDYLRRSGQIGDRTDGA